MWKKIYNKLNLKSPKVQVWYFAIIPFIIILIWCFVSIHIKENEIAEQEIKKQFTKDSLKIINDSLQKIYINSSSYIDSVNTITKFKTDFKDHTWSVDDIEIDTTRKKNVVPYLMIKNINDSIIRCGETYNSCEQFKKTYCKNKTNTILAEVMNKNNYTEYKNCLELVDIGVEFDTTYKWMYDTSNVKKVIRLSDIKFRYNKIKDDSVYRFFVRLDYKNKPKRYEYKNNKFSVISEDQYFSIFLKGLDD